MQVAGLPVELPSPDNPEISIQAKRSNSKENQLDGTKGKSQGSQTTSTSPTRTSKAPQTSPSTIIPAPPTFIMSPSSSPVTITPSTITIFTTKAITQTIPNPGTVISSSSSSLPPKSTTDKASFLFNPLSNTTVCGSLNITWLYNGQSVVATTLIVQNQVDAASGPMITQPTESVTFRTLISDIPSNMDLYLWAPVDIDEGWYTAKAFDTGELLGISGQSAPFFVAQTQLHPPCPMANNTISSTNTTDSSGHPVLHAPEIVGITLGGIVGSVALLVLVFIVPRFWRKELPVPKARRPRLLY